MNSNVDNKSKQQIHHLASCEDTMAALLHEIKSPLTVVLLGLSSLEKEGLSERGRMRLSLALEEALRLKRMLQKSWLSAKPSQAKWRVLDLRFLLCQILQVNTFLAPSQYQITLRSTDSEVYVFGDSDQLKQVFINLINNACEATPQGREISCCLGVDSASNQVYFSIHNWGEPIPAALLYRLTEPFVTTKSYGTGLGLTIVKQIVEMHGGCLHITSSRDSGTKVTVRLPKL